MKVIHTDYGTVHVLKTEPLMFELAARMKKTARKVTDRDPVIALTGGGTPQAFYEWACGHMSTLKGKLERVVWTVSDERCVPFDSDQSNWGNAWRGWLEPMGVPHGKRLPWPVTLGPEVAASRYNHIWLTCFGGHHRAFDLCLLGMGDDCHIASLFPDCPIIARNRLENFAAIEWPGRGWRLTITPAGLSRCDQIVVIVTGERKAGALAQVLQGSFQPLGKPAQLLKAHNDRTVWLVDEGAASRLA